MKLASPSYPANESSTGLYVHVPFCRSRCHYCAFVSSLHDPALEEPYVRSVIREIELWRDRIARGDVRIRSQVDTLYFGGGTPSVIQPERILRIIRAVVRSFELNDSAEITLEINPATSDKSRLSELRQAGINRVSLGIQSLHDEELLAMGRPHTAIEALRAFEELRSVGFANISVDLLAGFPGQTPQTMAYSLDRVVALGAEHVSVYLLEVKSHTKLFSDIQNGMAAPTDDDLAADLYELICSTLSASGYDHYEISNFCLRGFESRHNLKYWDDSPFLGIGPGAHGMTGRHRYANVDDLVLHEQATRHGAFPFEWREELDAETRFRDALIMGLRRVQGIDLKLLGDRYGVDAAAMVMHTIGDLTEAGLFVMRDDHLLLTNRGRLLSNLVFSRWV